jgi:hypothetical protein
MIRRKFLRRLVLAGAVLAAGAAAADPVEDITEEIRAQGFKIVRVQRTWLGRVRIIGQNASFRREVVIDPTTGEIRRDLLIPRSFPQPPPSPTEPSDAPEPSGGGTEAENGGWGGGWGSQGEPVSEDEEGGDAN